MWEWKFKQASRGGCGAGEEFDYTKNSDARVCEIPPFGKSTSLNKLRATLLEVCSSCIICWSSSYYCVKKGGQCNCLNQCLKQLRSN